MPDVHHFNAPDNTGCAAEKWPEASTQVSVKGRFSSARLSVHTLLHPPALAFVPPSFIPSSYGIFPLLSSFILASNFCACPLPRALARLCSSLLTASFLWASGSHLCIPVSHFGMQPVLLPAGPVGRDHPAIAAKKKKKVLCHKNGWPALHSALLFSEQLFEFNIHWPLIILESVLCTEGSVFDAVCVWITNERSICEADSELMSGFADTVKSLTGCSWKTNRAHLISD